MTKPTRLQVEVAAALRAHREHGAFASYQERRAIKEATTDDGSEFRWIVTSAFVHAYRLGLAAARRESKRGKGKA